MIIQQILHQNFSERCMSINLLILHVREGHLPSFESLVTLLQYAAHTNEESFLMSIFSILQMLPISEIVNRNLVILDFLSSIILRHEIRQSTIESLRLSILIAQNIPLPDEFCLPIFKIVTNPEFLIQFPSLGESNVLSTQRRIVTKAIKFLQYQEIGTDDPIDPSFLQHSLLDFEKDKRAANLCLAFAEYAPEFFSSVNCLSFDKYIRKAIKCPKMSKIVHVLFNEIEDSHEMWIACGLPTLAIYCLNRFGQYRHEIDLLRDVLSSDVGSTVAKVFRGHDLFDQDMDNKIKVELYRVFCVGVMSENESLVQVLLNEYRFIECLFEICLSSITIEDFDSFLQAVVRLVNYTVINNCQAIARDQIDIEIFNELYEISTDSSNEISLALLEDIRGFMNS